MAKGNGKVLTDRGLAGLKPGEWAFDPAPRGAGQLQARKLAGGEVCFYFRYTSTGDKRDRYVIGTGIDLSTARKKAAKLSARYQSGDRDLRAVLEAEEREKQRHYEAHKQAEAAKAGASLGALLRAYCDLLDRDGKASAGQVRGALTRHVKDAWPVLWTTPAVEVSTRDLLAVVARVVDLGKLREAAKLRSYVRAAYASGIRAQQSAQGLPALRVLDITHNPAADLVTIEGASKPGERALSLAELRAYWTRICATPGAPGAALRFHLLTGGQRVQQLARLTIHDRDVDSQTVRLYDPKGRRKTPRAHDVPLIKPAQKALDEMRGNAPAGDFLFTLTQGITAISYESLRDWVVIVRAAMVEAGELPGGAFTVGDLRRTIETRLAGDGISKEHRSQLQSHGISGVQSRHYDRHEYFHEKLAALKALHRLLTGTSAKGTPVSRKRSA
ncbi:MAG TPA: tyrosine-type recombinase/integrase [Luteibacter sp.]|jgi:integrase|nr:tyrosine-type recombinase/integrase [Luteibacter sp.]